MVSNPSGLLHSSANWLLASARVKAHQRHGLEVQAAYQRVNLATDSKEAAPLFKNRVIGGDKMKLLVLLAMVLLMSGCSGDPKAASKANFERAATAKFSEMEKSGDFCVGPATVPYNDTPKWMDSNRQKLALQKLEKLELLQVVESQPGERGKKYDLTDLGRKYFEANRGFCFVRPEVVSILKFTEPADLQGERVSKVTLLMKVAPVRSDPELEKLAFEINPKVKEEAKEVVVPFVLTSEGWQAK